MDLWKTWLLHSSAAVPLSYIESICIRAWCKRGSLEKTSHKTSTLENYKKEISFAAMSNLLYQETWKLTIVVCSSYQQMPGFETSLHFLPTQRLCVCCWCSRFLALRKRIVLLEAVWEGHTKRHIRHSRCNIIIPTQEPGIVSLACN